MTTRAAGIKLTPSQQRIHQALLEIFSPKKAKQFITYMKKKATATKKSTSTSMPMKPAKMEAEMKKKSKKKC